MKGMCLAITLPGSKLIPDSHYYRRIAAPTPQDSRLLKDVHTHSTQLFLLASLTDPLCLLQERERQRSVTIYYYPPRVYQTSLASIRLCVSSLHHHPTHTLPVERGWYMRVWHTWIWGSRLYRKGNPIIVYMTSSLRSIALALNMVSVGNGRTSQATVELTNYVKNEISETQIIDFRLSLERIEQNNTRPFTE